MARITMALPVGSLTASESPFTGVYYCHLATPNEALAGTGWDTTIKMIQLKGFELVRMKQLVELSIAENCKIMNNII